VADIHLIEFMRLFTAALAGADLDALFAGT